MKIQTDVIINADIETVWKAFDNPDNMTRWQPTLTSFKHESGERGRPGAISTLVYDENGREVVMMEEVTERRAPHFMASSYDSDWGKAIIVNHFEKVGDSQTRWVAYWRHVFRGMRRLLAIFMVKSMQKRVEDDMQRFKLMVESDQASR
ncbi:MAG: SRPBCC family protein [Woeseiaceae bacterium]|nr:SRPBCC family protein [Woeseiaceae bacterium]